MDRINGADTIDIGGGRRGFRDENLAAGAAGTEVSALWLNMTQEEILKVVTEAGLAPSEGDWTQLWQALQILGLASGSRSRRWVAVMSMTLSSAPGAPASGDTYLIPVGATGIWALHAGKIAQWTGNAWTYLIPPDGHGISLPDGRVFERVAGTYVEKLALDAQSGKWNFAVASGTANALTATLSPAPASLSVGMVVHIKVAAANTGAATLNLNGLGVQNIVRADGTALKAGDIPANSITALVYDGTNFQVAGVSGANAPLSGSSMYGTAGTFTFTVPDGVYRVLAECWGAGGGGGGAGSSGSAAAASAGGGGAYARKWISVTPGQVLNVLVGAGGGGGSSSGGNGGNAGSSSVGGVVSAVGGSAGTGVVNTIFPGAAGIGGTATGGDINISGYPGGFPVGIGPLGGIGGTSFSSSSPPPNQNEAGNPGVFPGGGGNGASRSGTGNSAGGAGARGLVIISY